jgi:hypothetical protein
VEPIGGQRGFSNPRVVPACAFGEQGTGGRADPRIARTGREAYADAAHRARSPAPQTPETFVKPDEIKKLEAYFKRTFQSPAIEIKARPRKLDSAEVYVGDEFIGLVYKDEEDGEGDYNFSMAILGSDL